jgi:hypothetical protein
MLWASKAYLLGSAWVFALEFFTPIAKLNQLNLLQLLRWHDVIAP